MAAPPPGRAPPAAPPGAAVARREKTEAGKIAAVDFAALHDARFLRLQLSRAPRGEAATNARRGEGRNWAGWFSSSRE